MEKKFIKILIISFVVLILSVSALAESWPIVNVKTDLAQKGIYKTNAHKVSRLNLTFTSKKNAGILPNVMERIQNR